MGYTSQIKALNEAVQKKKDCDAKQKKYEVALKAYNEKLAQYKKDMKKYEQDMAAYKTAMAELEKHKNEDGYLKQPEAQSLIFESEPNAKMHITSGSKEYGADEWYNEAVRLDYIKETSGNWPKLKKAAYDGIKAFDDSLCQ